MQGLLRTTPPGLLTQFNFSANTATLIMGVWRTGSDRSLVYCSLDLKGFLRILKELQGWTTPPGLLRQFKFGAKTATLIKGGLCCTGSDRSLVYCSSGSLKHCLG